MTIFYASSVIMIAKLRFDFGTRSPSYEHEVMRLIALSAQSREKRLSISNVLSVSPGNSQREGEESGMLGTNSYWYCSATIMRV